MHGKDTSPSTTDAPGETSISPARWSLRSFAPTPRDALVVFVLGSLVIGAALAWPARDGPPVLISPGEDGSSAAGIRIDVNSAPAIELTLLPGIGPSLADAIVASRQTDGPFAAVDDLQRVRGIGPAKVAGLRDYAVAAASD